MNCQKQFELKYKVIREMRYKLKHCLCREQVEKVMAELVENEKVAMLYLPFLLDTYDKLKREFKRKLLEL